MRSLRLQSAFDCKADICDRSLPGRNFIRFLLPPPPRSWPEGIFKVEGGGVHFEAPLWQDFYPPPSFTPPAPRRVFSGLGGFLREIGTMWQIGVLTGRPCTFWSKMSRFSAFWQNVVFFFCLQHKQGFPSGYG